MCVTIDNIQICFPYFIGTRTFFPFFFLPSSIYVNAVRRDFSVAIPISLFTPIFHFDFQVALLSLSTTELPLVVRLNLVLVQNLRKSEEEKQNKQTSDLIVSKVSLKIDFSFSGNSLLSLFPFQRNEKNRKPKNVAGNVLISSSSFLLFCIYVYLCSVQCSSAV